MRSRNESGAVTAEAAVVIPVLALFTLVMMWFVSWGIAAVRVQDAAREAARVIARGDDPSAGTGLARRVAPERSRVDIERDPQTVAVVVSAPVRGPGGLLGFLPSVTVRGRAVAAIEEAP